MGEDNGLQFDIAFNLEGGGLEKGTAGLQQLQGALQRGQKAVFEFEREGRKMRATFEEVGSGIGKASSSMHGFAVTLGDVIQVAGRLASAIKKPFEMLDAFGDKAITAFGERNSAIRAYTTLLGSATQAEIEFSKAQALAAKTDLTAEATQKAQQQLLVSGLRGQTKDAMLLGGLDLASIAPGDKNEALKSYARAVSQIQQKGKLQSEELLQLAEGSSLGSGFVKQQLQSILGVKDNAAVDKKLKKGEVSADQGLLAIQRATLAQLGTKKLGEYATGSAGSLQGLLSNRDEALQNLLKGFDNEALPGIKRYKAALTEQGALFDVNTEAGKRLSLTLQSLSSTSAEVKSAWTDFTTSFYDSFSRSYMDALRATGSASETGTSAIRSLGEQIGKLGDLSFRALNLIVPALEKAAFFLGGEGKNERALRLQKDSFARADQEGAKSGALAQEMYAYFQDHPSLKKFPNLFNEALSASGASVTEKVANALDARKPSSASSTSAIRSTAGGVASAGSSSSGGGGWAVPWARSERFEPGWSRVARSGADILEQGTAAREARSAAREAASNSTVNIVINVEGGNDSALAIAKAVEDRLDEKFRSMGRMLRGPSPARI